MFTLAIIKTHKFSLLLVIISVVLYSVFAYHLERTDYLKLVSIYAILFVLFYKLIQLNKENVNFLTAVAFLSRALFILAIPNLSQDFYRFIWDGRMLLEGYNPYLYTPESFISNGKYPIAQAQELYIGMRELNASHFTNYTPINQLCFSIAALFAGKSIIGSAFVLRLLIIAADFGTLYFGKKLLQKLKLPIYNIFWFILNPFIIIELTGNLHFESVMIFFLVWSLYLLHSQKWKWAAVVFALSIATKLVPLMFLPLFYWWFVKNRNTNIAVYSKQFVEKDVDAISKKTLRNNRIIEMIRLIKFYSIVLITTLLLFAPFFSIQFIDNYSKTVGLWFGNFEFNASIYYLLRNIGYLFRGYNEIAIIGKAIPIIVFVFVLCITFFRKNKTTTQLITAMLIALTFYYFTATTVHPWYIATVLILSVFTKYKFPLVWSCVMIVSYLAYININKADKSENLWIIAFEYVIIYSVFIWEVFIKKASKLEA